MLLIRALQAIEQIGWLQESKRTSEHRQQIVPQQHKRQARCRQPCIKRAWFLVENTEMAAGSKASTSCPARCFSASHCSALAARFITKKPAGDVDTADTVSQHSSATGTYNNYVPALQLVIICSGRLLHNSAGS